MIPQQTPFSTEYTVCRALYSRFHPHHILFALRDCAECKMLWFRQFKQKKLKHNILLFTILVLFICSVSWWLSGVQSCDSSFVLLHCFKEGVLLLSFFSFSVDWCRVTSGVLLIFLCLFMFCSLSSLSPIRVEFGISSPYHCVTPPPFPCISFGLRLYHPVCSSPPLLFNLIHNIQQMV